MKKILLLTLLGLFILNACNKEDAKQETENVVEDDGKNESIEVDKGLLNVEVTLPASLFENQDIDEVIEGAKAEGVKEVIKNDDGSLTYIMSKSEHKKVLSEMEEDINQDIEELKSGEDFPSIKDVKKNNSYSEFTIVVNREKFENSFDGMASIGLGLSAMFYQVFSGVDDEKAKVTVNFEDENTGEIIDTVVYPDELNNE